MIGPFRGEYAFLSNFYPADVVLDGVLYPSVEHAFQAAKTLDPAERRAIQHARTPAEARRMGRRVNLRPDWEVVRCDVMYDLVRQKFRRHSGLARRLLATGQEELVELNTWGDTFWGVCGSRGENRLGKILMAVRAELAREIGL